MNFRGGRGIVLTKLGYGRQVSSVEVQPAAHRRRGQKNYSTRDHQDSAEQLHGESLYVASRTNNCCEQAISLKTPAHEDEGAYRDFSPTNSSDAYHTDSGPNAL